jgi:hypothetical protein
VTLLPAVCDLIRRGQTQPDLAGPMAVSQPIASQLEGGHFIRRRVPYMLCPGMANLISFAGLRREMQPKAINGIRTLRSRLLLSLVASILRLLQSVA